MEDRIQQALEQDNTIDIITIGRKSGEPRRIEIWFHYVENEVYITGLPGTRDWYANLLANPEFTFHLKQSTQADIPATAVPIEDEAQRREILQKILVKINRSGNLEQWVARSPLMHVILEIEKAS